MGGDTPTSGNAPGSMNTWSDYNAVLQQQQQQSQFGQAVGKGLEQFGSGLASGAKPSGALNVPQMANQPIPQGGVSGSGSIPQIATAQPQGISLESLLARILGA